MMRRWPWLLAVVILRLHTATTAAAQEEAAPVVAREGTAGPAQTGQPELRTSITNAGKLAKKLAGRAAKLKERHAGSAKELEALATQIVAMKQLIASFDERFRTLEQRPAKATDDAAETQFKRDEDALEKDIAGATKALQGIEGQIEVLEQRSGSSLVDNLLTARCSTAICFNNDDRRNWLGIEPLVELPIGIGFAISDSGISDYINNHDLRVDLAAGVRLWLFRDWISISVYFSKPLISSSIRLGGSDFVYPGSAVRRPYPGFALGLLFDSIWIGFDRNELRNGDGEDGSSFNPEFPPNALVSAGWTITLALQPVTAFRTAIGTAVQSEKAGKDK